MNRAPIGALRPQGTSIVERLKALFAAKGLKSMNKQFAYFANSHNKEFAILLINLDNLMFIDYIKLYQNIIKNRKEQKCMLSIFFRKFSKNLQNSFSTCNSITIRYKSTAETINSGDQILHTI